MTQTDSEEIRQHVEAIKGLIARSNADFRLFEELGEEPGPGGCAEMWVAGTTAGIITFGVGLIDAAVSIEDGETKRLDVDDLILGSEVSGIVVSRDDSHRAEPVVVTEASSWPFWITIAVLLVLVGLVVIGAIAVVRWFF